MGEYYRAEPVDVLRQLQTDENGLSEEEAKKRLGQYGRNELEKKGGPTAFSIFFDQFKNALIILLIFAGVLSLMLGETLEAGAMFFIVLLNAILGFVQEYRAEKAMEALQKISAPTARVLRGGQEREIPAAEIVPGDLLILEAGDIIPADSRILESISLQIDEAALTGESVPSKKVVGSYDKETPLADQENMAFMSTVVTYGKGKAVATQTGMRTEFGKIAQSLQETEAMQTPLQKKFSQLARQIGVVALLLIGIVFLTGWGQGITLIQMVIFALALTVSTVPSALPVVVTVGLSMGAKRLAKKNMLIKKLPAAESLGAATIICSDKTGTITKNQMTVTHLYTDGQVVEVSGTGYVPTGSFTAQGKGSDVQDLELLLRIGALCNSAKLTQKNEVIGDPTEGALVVLGRKGGVSLDELKTRHTFVTELPFDADRKAMSVVYRKKQELTAYVKGAPEILLQNCTHVLMNGKVKKLTKTERDTILEQNTAFAEQALRVLACAYRDVSSVKDFTIKNVEQQLIFVGLAGMIDPAREEVKPALEDCRKAGIEVMIITGDSAITAKAVARDIGLYQDGDLVLTGTELEKLSDKELAAKIDKIRIIARALPLQKSRIVDMLQQQGHVVAMTGDGVNDAPALKKADIGIAMGITGTDVTKEVAKATLVDDNFASIVRAISEGRTIYDKMIKSAKYLLSCNAGEIAAVFLAIVLRFPLPLLPLQILLMNLLTDSFPALGLGFEGDEEGVMERPPRDPAENPLTREMLFSMMVFGLVMGIGTLFLFSMYEDGKAQTVAFTTLVVFQMFAVMSSRSLLPSLKELNPFSNMWLFGAVMLSMIIQLAVLYVPFLQVVFGTVPLDVHDWIKILAVASMGFVLMEMSKFGMRFHWARGGAKAMHTSDS